MNPVIAIVAFLVPPFSVYRMRGLDSSFWLNVVLTALGYIAGSIHAFVVFARATPEQRARTYR